MTAWLLLLLLLLLCGSAVVMVVTLCRCRRLLWYKYDDWLMVTPRTCRAGSLVTSRAQDATLKAVFSAITELTEIQIIYGLKLE